MSQSGGGGSGNMKKMSTGSTELPLKRERGTWERGEMGAEGTGCWTAASDTIRALLGRNCDLQSYSEFLIEGFLFIFMSGNITYAISTCFTSLDMCWMVQEQQHKSPPQRSWRLAHHKTPQTEATGFHWGGFHSFLPTLILFRPKSLVTALAGLFW